MTSRWTGPDDEAEASTEQNRAGRGPQPSTSLTTGWSLTCATTWTGRTDTSDAEPVDSRTTGRPEESLGRALEAILLVVDEPVSEVVLAQVLETPQATWRQLVARARRVHRVRAWVRAARGRRGMAVLHASAYASVVERFVVDGQQARLTQAALETLAVVAYRQPVSRARISAVRGVNVDGVMRTLVSRGLIEECGTEPESGAFLYRTRRTSWSASGLTGGGTATVGALPPDIETLDIDSVSTSG